MNIRYVDLSACIARRVRTAPRGMITVLISQTLGTKSEGNPFGVCIVTYRSPDDTQSTVDHPQGRASIFTRKTLLNLLAITNEYTPACFIQAAHTIVVLGCFWLI